MKKKLKERARRKDAVPYVKFVKAWKKAASVKEVAKKCGILPASASSIASRLRSRGVKLKKFETRRTQTIDAKHLNKLVRS